MRKRFTLGLTMACAAAALASADANTPKNALGAIAVSPDGATLVAAGDNRVLYVLDPASLEVKQRVAIGVNPYAAYFSADGKTLAIHDTDGAVTLFNAADWSVKTAIVMARTGAPVQEARRRSTSSERANGLTPSPSASGSPPRPWLRPTDSKTPPTSSRAPG